MRTRYIDRLKIFIYHNLYILEGRHIYIYVYTGYLMIGVTPQSESRLFFSREVEKQAPPRGKGKAPIGTICVSVNIASPYLLSSLIN